MKMHIRLFFIAFIFSSTIHAQWHSLPVGEGNSLVDLDMVSETIGYGHFIHNLDGRHLAQTKDAGLTWDLMSVPDTLSLNTLRAIDFYAEDKGILAFTDWALSPYPTTILRTLDNGATWEDITPLDYTGGAPILNTVNDDLIFMATGTYLFKSLDSGASWTNYGTPYYIESLDFIDDQNGVIGLFDGTFAYMGGMFCTNDGGENWQGTMLDMQYSVVSDVQMINENFVIATPFAPIVVEDTYHHYYISTDMGMTWDTIAYPELNDDTGLLGIEFKNPDEGFISIGDYEGSKIYKTNDGGANWSLELDLPEYIVSNINHAGNLTYLAGGYEEMYRSDIPSSTKDIGTKTVNVFPNPARPVSIITIDSPLTYDEITFIDQSGRQVFKQQMEYPNTVQVPTLYPGVYVAQLRNEQEVSSFRLVIID